MGDGGSGNQVGNTSKCNFMVVFLSEVSNKSQSSTFTHPLTPSRLGRGNEGQTMKTKIILAAALLLFTSHSAIAYDLTDMAECTVKVFTEINKTRKWSGKPPAGCRVAVEKRQDGVFVTAWRIRSGNKGWIRTSLSGAMGYAEIATAKVLAGAGRDIVKRAARLERCLDSINSVNDPLECRDRATKSYLAGETTGTENQRLIWLDDNGRHVVAEYATGNTAATPTPPTELFNGEKVPVGVILKLDWN